MTLRCCDDVALFLGDPDDHCGSCHEDINEGYPAGYIEIDGREVEVCCVVMRSWDARGVPESPSTP